MARFWGSAPRPVGRQLDHYFGESTIIGVAARVDHDELADPPKATAYYTTHQFAYVPNGSLLVRSEMAGTELVSAVRAAVRQVDGSVPLYDVQTMEGLVARSARLLALTAFVSGGTVGVEVGKSGAAGDGTDSSTACASAGRSNRRDPVWSRPKPSNSTTASNQARMGASTSASAGSCSASRSRCASMRSPPR